MTATIAEKKFDPRELVARVLRPIAEVRPGETITALALTGVVFLLLLGYYLLKVVREPLILDGGAEVKSYAAAGQALLLVLVVKGHGWLAQRVGRMRLIVTVSTVLGACLAAFALALRAGVSIGVPFYLFVGVFSLTMLAQFWGFANDVYDPLQGKRLFAILGVGSALGAVFGARLAKRLYVPLGPPGMMMLTVGIVVVCTLVLRWVDRREHPQQVEKPAASASGTTLLFGDRYLMLIAALTLLLNWVNTTGEYILDRTLLDATRDHAFIAAFKADFYSWVNIVGIGLQLFFTSRILRTIGARGAVFVLPLIALGGYGLMAFAPILTAVAVAKVAENSVDYSVQSTARQALFLVASPSAKYTAKTLIDTFVVRAGDVCSAIVVAIGHVIGLSTRSFALFNGILVVTWIGVVVMLHREHARREEAK